MKNQFIKLKIPFATKSYIKNKPKKCYIMGYAYYIFDLDKQIIIDEYLELVKANYRITDIYMIKTKYYENKKVKNFRKKYLDKYSNIDINKFVYHHNKLENIKFEFLLDDQIKEINLYFKNQSMTIRRMYSLLSGSNISGAETKAKSSPIRCIDNNYFDCNFANVLAKYYNKLFKHKEYPSDLDEYGLDELINSDKVKNFKENFFQYNEDILYENCQINQTLDNEITYEQTIDNIEKYNFNEKQILFIEGFLNKTLDNYEQIVTSNFIKRKLRSYFNANIAKLLKNKFLPLFSTSEPFNLKIIENAHIISFASLLSKSTFESLTDAINPYNCLRIDTATHKLIDNDNYYFDKEGNLLNGKGEIVKQNYLDIKKIPYQSRIFFNSYLNKHFK